MDQLPTGVIVLFGTAAVVAGVAFAFIRRWWLAALLAFPAALAAFVLVCIVFNATDGSQPSVADLVPLGVAAAPVVLLVGSVSAAFRWLSRRLRRGGKLEGT